MIHKGHTKFCGCLKAPKVEKVQKKDKRVKSDEQRLAELVKAVSIKEDATLRR
ncbi:hypothetical protein [Clostridium sp. BNL1100]|uniref:hypothetical protein n=1 Tax=Clostridium sp. BNL1100 TaxID=755731 RepID=UPI00165159EC|nr:hypothetical protein [Clostridium sp. BNL1100]